MKFVFDIYDFDNDQYITKTDITTIISCMPVVRTANSIEREGKFTQEGGGATTFQERVNTLEEMTQVLNICFGEK
jgi:Ca2+-binding EF-hand superfamily protein